MSRLPHFGALLGLAALLSSMASAQNLPQANSANGARVEHVLVRGTGAAMEVEIQTSGATVAPTTQAITGPDRIVVDFPGALPAAELRALQVNRGALQRVRAGLFFKNPPITRIVLDLAQPQSYKISTTQHTVVIRLGEGNVASENVAQTNPPDVNQAKPKVNAVRATEAAAPVARLQNALLPTGTKLAPSAVSVVISRSVAPHALASLAVKVPTVVLPDIAPRAIAAPLPVEPLKPRVTVSYVNGMLRIHADRSTLAEVLFEVQRETQAEIAIPAGAEQEGVVADIGPAPARDVLGSLLNGSHYNFIFVGDELSLERVILSRKE
jgi:hypothetical protein